MRHASYLLVAAVLLTGCSALQGRDDNAVFDGVHYRADVKSSREARNVFSIEVRDATQGSLQGAREAGRYEAIKYCIKQTASSDIAWTVGPDDAAAARIDSAGNLVLQGRCVDPR